MQTIKVHNQFNAPKGKKQKKDPVIYEYDYIERKTGEIKTKKINLQEKIQSNLAKTDYKKMIERGELILDDNIHTEGYRDYTIISGDKVDIVDTITKISKLNQSQIDNLIEKITKQPEEQPQQNGEENRKNDTTTEQTKSNPSGDAGKTNESGEQ